MSINVIIEKWNTGNWSLHLAQTPGLSCSPAYNEQIEKYPLNQRNQLSHFFFSAILVSGLIKFSVIISAAFYGDIQYINLSYYSIFAYRLKIVTKVYLKLWVPNLFHSGVIYITYILCKLHIRVQVSLFFDISISSQKT